MALSDCFTNLLRRSGMRAEIAFPGRTTFRMRFSRGDDAVRTMRLHDLTMVLGRAADRPFELQVQPVCGAVNEIPRSSATVSTPMALAIVPVPCRDDTHT